MTIFLPLFQTLQPTMRGLENAADTVP